jgi:hypothetical protein
MGTVTGKDAKIWIASGGTTLGTWYGHAYYGISDFSLTIDRGVVEQELVGETGNYQAVGALSVEGSFSESKFATSGLAQDFYSLINGKFIAISGTTGSNLSFTFMSCQVTSADVSIGDADTITECSIDFTVSNCHQVFVSAGGHISDAW